MGKDYYGILGVGKGADEAELKKGMSAVPWQLSLQSQAHADSLLCCMDTICSLPEAGHEVASGEWLQPGLGPPLATPAAAAAACTTCLWEVTDMQHICYDCRIRTRTTEKQQRQSSRTYQKPMRWACAPVAAASTPQHPLPLGTCSSLVNIHLGC